MLCRIADPNEASPVAWRTLDVSQPVDLARTRSSDQAASVEVNDLKLRLQELEKTRQAELVQVKQTSYQEGRIKGREETADEARSAVDQLSQRLRELSALRKKIRDQAEADIVQLALAIARRILRRELATDPEAIQGVVHAALQKIQHRDLLRVRTYPEGAEALTQSLRKSGTPASVQIISDSTLKFGDVLFETSAGELNASLENQLQEVERGLTDRLASQ